MNEVQIKVAEQIGMLVISNTEQAVMIEKLQSEISVLKARISELTPSTSAPDSPPKSENDLTEHGQSGLTDN